MAGHIGGLVAGVMLAYVFPVRGKLVYEPNLSDECCPYLISYFCFIS